MECPHCDQVLKSVVMYFSGHQSIELNEQGEVGEFGPRHDDWVEDVACGSCLESLDKRTQDNIKGLWQSTS